MNELCDYDMFILKFVVDASVKNELISTKQIKGLLKSYNTFNKSKQYFYKRISILKSLKIINVDGITHNVTVLKEPVIPFTINYFNLINSQQIVYK